MMKRPKRKWLRNASIIFGAALLSATIFFWWLVREPHQIPWISDWPESRVRSYFGAPDGEATFWLTDRQELEYRDHLRYNFPEVDFTHDSVLIKESGWQGRFWNHCIWFKQQSGEWVVVEDLFWTEAIQF